MGYRTFRDSKGTEWQAWDIVPRLAERRATERRLRQMAVERERRQVAERRLAAGSRPTLLGHGMNAGWLCFEARDEKRRLAPIPPDWQACPLQRLQEYLGVARPTARIAIGRTG